MVNVLKKTGNRKSILNITFTKTEKKNTQEYNKWKTSNPTKKKKKERKKERKKEKRNIESTRKKGLKWQ